MAGHNEGILAEKQWYLLSTLKNNYLPNQATYLPTYRYVYLADTLRHILMKVLTWSKVGTYGLRSSVTAGY